MYKSWNVIENKQLFENVLNKEFENNDYYGSNYFFKRLLELDDEQLKNMDIVLNKGKLCAVLTNEKQYDLKFIDATILTNKNLYDFLSTRYPDSIVAINGYAHDISFHYYNEANMKSDTANETYQSNNTILVPKNIDENIVKNNIEKYEFPQLDKSKLVFENLSGEELRMQLINQYKNNICFSGFSQSDTGNYTVAGFHYFNLTSYEDEKQFLVCKQDDKYIGIIKHGIYSSYGTIPHQGLAYIDVNNHYRNQGIATMMIKELDQYLSKDYPLFLTSESDDGKKCHMERLFLENIKKTECITHDGQEEYYKNNKNLVVRDEER